MGKSPIAFCIIPGSLLFLKHNILYQVDEQVSPKTQYKLAHCQSQNCVDCIQRKKLAESSLVLLSRCLLSQYHLQNTPLVDLLNVCLKLTHLDILSGV